MCWSLIKGNSLKDKVVVIFFVFLMVGFGTKLYNFTASKELSRQTLIFLKCNFVAVAAIGESVVFHTESNSTLI